MDILGWGWGAWVGWGGWGRANEWLAFNKVKNTCRDE